MTYYNSWLLSNLFWECIKMRIDLHVQRDPPGCSQLKELACDTNQIGLVLLQLYSDGCLPENGSLHVTSAVLVYGGFITLLPIATKESAVERPFQTSTAQHASVCFTSAGK